MAKTLNVSLQISFDKIANLLRSGMEGGIGYWASIDEYIHPPEPANLKELFGDSWSEKLYKYIHYPLIKGAAVMLRDVEDSQHKVYRLDLPAIEKGLTVMAE